MCEIRQTIPKDYEGDKYNILHSWLHEVDEFLMVEFTDGNLEQNRKGWMDMITSQDASNIVLGAFFDGNLIGQASLQRKIGRQSHVGVWGVAINKDYHNKGIGTQLLREIERTAQEMGLMRLEVEVCDLNVAAKKLYIEKLGYTVEGKLKKAFRLKDGTLADMLCLGKILESHH